MATNESDKRRRTVAPAPKAAGSSNRASAAPVRIVVVNDASDGQRLDNFLAKACKGVPKSHLYQLIRKGQVRVNGGRAKADTRLELDDSVRLPPLRLSQPAVSPVSTMQAAEQARQGQSLPVVHEDDVLVIVDKPAGTAVHGGSGGSCGVIEQLRASRPDARFLELVHRLDRETSGLLMVAKKRSALRQVHEQMRMGKIAKTYLAVVAGKVAKRDRTVRLALRRYTTRDGYRRVVPDSVHGKAAVSHIIGLASIHNEQMGWVSLVRVRIETGRTHQIRVHMASLGYPVLGDRKYGDFELNRQIPGQRLQSGASRMCLHALELTLRHPVTGQQMTVRAAPPDMFSRLVGGLDLAKLVPQ